MLTIVHYGAVCYHSLMAYLGKLKNREGRIYYTIIESFRTKDVVKHRTIQRIGRHDQLMASGITDPEAYAMQAVAKFNETKIPTTLTKTITTAEKITPSLLNLGHQIPQKIYDAFGIPQILSEYSKNHKYEYDLNEVLKLLVLGRILSPASKSSTIDSFQATLAGNWHISQNDMDRSLDHLQLLKQPIQEEVHKNITKLTNRTGYLAFYDITNYYFETDLDDPDELANGSKTILNKTQQKKQGIKPEQVVATGLRKRGASKEYRRNPIVQLGLFMDEHGIPIAYEIFPGNFSDPKTYIPAMEQLKKQFNLIRIITVADKAMNSKDNISDAANRGDGWLFSQKVRGTTGIPKDIQNFVLDPGGWEYNKDMTVAKKSMIRTRKLDNKKDGKTVTEKVVVTWRESYAKREKARRDGAVAYASALSNPELFRRTMRKGGKKYLQMTVLDMRTGKRIPAHPHLSIDQTQVDFDAQFDGMNAIVTSEVDMPDEQIITTYGQLSKVEDCFRVTKFNLHARPVYVWTKTHIEAHFLTCFIALAIMRYLQYKLNYKYSPTRIIEALKNITGQYWAQGYWEVFSNDDAREILKLLGISMDRRYISVRAALTIGKELTV